METILHHTNKLEKTVTGTSIFHRLESFSVSNDAEEAKAGKSLNFFIYMYIGIFSAIMVAVMIAEKYFIQ